MPAASPRVLSIIPPMTQLNTPYPSTAYLTGFLRSRGVHAVQEDLALALVLKLLSREGLLALREAVAALPASQRNARIDTFDARFDEHLRCIEPVLAFLQGRDATLMHRIAGRAFLPEGPRFASLEAYASEDGGDPLAWAFGALGTHDRARHLATLYLNDLADVLRDAVDARFEFVRYGERLAASQASFDAAGRRIGGAAQPGGPHAARADAAGAGAPCADGGAAVGAFPRRGLCRLPHRADDQGPRPSHRHRARRRLRQHRTARAERAAGLRPLRLRHARCR